MKKLYAPWRHDYVTGVHKKHGKAVGDSCIFCLKFQDSNDAKHLIIKRFERCAIVMNYYPYNAGHLMVLPLEHKASLENIDKQTRADIMEAVTITITTLSETMKSDGYNIGINLGVAGGGGIPSHLHVHVLPRWLGDTNFLATIGETTLICSDFNKMYETFKEAFKNKEI